MSKFSNAVETRFTHVGAKYLSSVLKEYQRLKNLNISINDKGINNIESQGAEYLSEGLIENKGLKEFRLG